MKDIILFLWIFIIPILVWLISVLFSSKKEMPQKASFRKMFMQFYVGLEILVYLGAVIILFILYNIGELSENNFIEFLYRFCIFQIGILDMWFLIFSSPKHWLYLFLHLLSTSLGNKIEKIYHRYPSVITGGIITSFFATMLIPIFLMLLHLESIQDIFIEQKVPLAFIIFILIFNPVFMFYQLKESLLKND